MKLRMSEDDAKRCGIIAGGIARCIIMFVCSIWANKQDGKLAKLTGFMCTTALCADAYNLGDYIFND